MGTHQSESTIATLRGNSAFIPAREHAPSQPVIAELSPDTVNDLQRVKESLRLAAEEHNCHLIAFTSASAEAGSSTLAAYLSLMLAESQNGYYVSGSASPGIGISPASTTKEATSGTLLLDANLRKPSLHTFLGLTRDAGLSEILRERVAFENACRGTSWNNLKFLASGEAVHNPLPLLSSARMKEIFAELKRRFQYILIDTPPILDYADAVVLCQLVDGVVLVLKAGDTRLEKAENARKILERARTRILGVVLNQRKSYLPDSIARRF